jgi:hypothetical protein
VQETISEDELVNTEVKNAKMGYDEKVVMIEKTVAAVVLEDRAMKPAKEKTYTIGSKRLRS